METPAPNATTEPSPTPYKPGMPDRRKRKPDPWARVFRYMTLLIYPVLIAYVLIFVGVASEDQRAAMAKQIGQTAGERAASAGLQAFLPIMLAGLAIGVLGLLLSRKRARRRSDYNYQTQLILIILSVGGLLIYFFARDVFL